MESPGCRSDDAAAKAEFHFLSIHHNKVKYKTFLIVSFFVFRVVTNAGSNCLYKHTHTHMHAKEDTDKTGTDEPNPLSSASVVSVVSMVLAEVKNFILK